MNKAHRQPVDTFFRPIGGLAAAIIFIFFHAPKTAKPVVATWKEKGLQMDPVGIVLIMGLITSFTLAMQYGGQTKPWKSSDVIGLLVGFGLFLITFIGWERFQGERAMVPPRIFKQRFLWPGALFQFFFSGGYFVLLYYIPIYFQSIDNTSAIGSGVRNLPLVIAVMIAGMVGGITVSATGYAYPLMVGGSAVATVGIGLIYTWDIGTPIGKWIGYQFFAGFFFSLPWMLSMNIAQAHSAPIDLPSATAMIFCTCLPFPSVTTKA